MRSSAPACPATRVSAPRAPTTLRLALLVLEGYAYLLGIVAVFVAVVALLVWGLVARRPLLSLTALLLGVPVVLVTAGAVRALVFRLPQAHGVVVRPGEAPALERMVAEVARAVGAPRVDEIVVSGVFNASALEAPRLSRLARRRTLVLGYPLLVALAPEQLRAVIAHELAHLAHAHSSLAGRIYRARTSWHRVLGALAARGTMPIFVRWLAAAYLPRLHAQSSEAARAQEYLADRNAADVAGSRVAADTLVAIGVGAQRLDGAFWPAVSEALAESDEPPRPFTRMRAAPTELLSPEEGVLDALLADTTERLDSHPCLRDRLAALGEPARAPAPPTTSAGETYLGPFLDVVARRLDAEWLEAHGDTWRERRRSGRRIAELAAAVSPTADARYEHGALLEEAGRDDDALRQYREALELDLSHAGATLALGRLLLDRDDAAGIDCVERAMSLDAARVPEGCALLSEYHHAHGRPADAQRYQARATRHATRAALAEAERNELTAVDRFTEHGLPPHDVAAVTAAVAREPGVRAAFLVRKMLRHSEGTRTVLGVVTDRGAAAEALERLRAAATLPAGAQVVAIGDRQESLVSALEAVRGSRIQTR